MADTLHHSLLALYGEVSSRCDCKVKQDGQCTHNVTMRRVHETVVAVEKQ